MSTIACMSKAVSLLPVMRIALYALALGLIPALLGSSQAGAGTSTWIADSNGGGCQSYAAVDRVDGSLYIPNYETLRILHYTGTGTNLGSIGPATSYAGVASAPGGGVIAFETSGWAREYSSSGALVRSFPLGGSDLASDAAGNLYTLGSDSVRKYDSSGSLLTTWGSYGDGPGQFNFYGGRADIAVDPSGNAFVVDANDRVQEFTSAGTFVRQWGTPGSAEDQFNRVRALWADGFGHVYAGNQGYSPPTGALKRFSTAGAFEGSPRQPGQVSALTGDGDNLVYAINCSVVYRFELTQPDVNPQFAGQPVVGSPVTIDANGSVPFGTISSYEFDLDNNGTYEVSGISPSATVTYDSVGSKTVGVRVTSNRGGVATGTATKSVVPSGPVGVTINDGDYATNSTKVRVNPVWPAGATGVTLSNDGGFKSSGGTRSFALSESIPWTLRSQAAERMTRIVYLRFDGGPLGGQNYSDDIILDTTAPVLDAASLASKASSAGAAAKSKKFKVRVRASQKKSGVSVVQLGVSKKAAAEVRLRSRWVKGITKLNKTVTASLARAPKFVRVQSAAGTWSKWKRLR